MSKLLKQIKNNYEQNQKLFDVATVTTADGLNLAIYKQRYNNISLYVDKYINDSNCLTEDEVNLLKNYYLLNNGLKEMNIIGTDLYINAKFIKQKVLYLYRCVGKDNEYKYEELELKNHVNEIFKMSCKQIQTGGKGCLFSYSKCFGLMLYKYATVITNSDIVIIEIRKNAWINAIQKDDKNLMLQEYLMQCEEKTEEEKLPYFSIDMSNARDNDVNNLRRWIESYLGKQNWHYGSEILDPIGDAEVVMNFTNTINENNSTKEIMAENVFRKGYNIIPFCGLLYQYFKKYYEMQYKNIDLFYVFIEKSINTLPNDNKEDFSQFYKGVKGIEPDEILGYVDWELEKKYMIRKKDDDDDSESASNKTELIAVYKGDNAEWKTIIWKEILYEALRKKYSHINYGGNNEI